MFLSFQSIFFIIPKYVFYASYSMFFFSRGAYFLLICCMFYFSTFSTYPLHVIYFFTACFFSRMYSLFQSYLPIQSIFLFTDSLPTRVSILFISMRSLLLARPSFICTPLESIPQMYICRRPFYLLPSLCFACCVLLYLFCAWIVCSFFYDGRQCMFPITYHVCFSIAISILLFPVICISMSNQSSIHVQCFSSLVVL